MTKSLALPCANVSMPAKLTILFFFIWNELLSITKTVTFQPLLLSLYLFSSFCCWYIMKNTWKYGHCSIIIWVALMNLAELNFTKTMTLNVRFEILHPEKCASHGEIMIKCLPSFITLNKVAVKWMLIISSHSFFVAVSHSLTLFLSLSFVLYCVRPCVFVCAHPRSLSFSLSDCFIGNRDVLSAI